MNSQAEFTEASFDSWLRFISQCKDSMLGEFEYLILAAAVRLGDDAYGAAIVQ
jgi:hypothetical protein